MAKKKRTQAYWAKHRLMKCECGGYWFPHRKGGGACDHSPTADYHTAIRAGISRVEAMQLLSAGALNNLFPLKK